MRGVIQVGAHYAEEYEGWLSMGVKDFVFFEPIKASYAKLMKIFSITPRVRIFNLALGNHTGKVDMFIETEHQGKSCSILEPYLHLEQYPDIKFTGKETVDIDRLDNIKIDRSLYDHLHIDTQGYELEVLKGAEQTLKSIETIEVEVYRKELYKGCPMMDDIAQYLSERGFDVESVFWRGNTWGDLKLSR